MQPRRSAGRTGGRRQKEAPAFWLRRRRTERVSFFKSSPTPISQFFPLLRKRPKPAHQPQVLSKKSQEALADMAPLSHPFKTLLKQACEAEIQQRWLPSLYFLLRNACLAGFLLLLLTLKMQSLWGNLVKYKGLKRLPP